MYVITASFPFTFITKIIISMFLCDMRIVQNETSLGIVLEEGVEAVRNSLQGHYGQHPIDTCASGFSL
jgi:hypothetical protein